MMLKKTTDKILDALNPINPADLPVIHFSLREITKVIEANMDAEQKTVSAGLNVFFSSKGGAVDYRGEVSEMMKNLMGGES